MSGRISSADTGGKRMSGRQGLYRTRFCSLKTAGYVGLLDLQQLRDLYNSQQWQGFYQAYVSAKRACSFTAAPALQGLYEHVDAWKEYNIAPWKGHKKFGLPIPIRVFGWSRQDFYAWSILKILKMAPLLPGPPAFGPFECEAQLEAYNRAWQMLAHYSFLVNSERIGGLLSDKFRPDCLLGDNFMNKPAVKPKFMIPLPPYVPAPPPVYIPYRFSCVWRNKPQIEAQHPDKVLADSSFQIPDPRVHNFREIRDYVRCAVHCVDLRLDLSYLRVKHEDESGSSWEGGFEIQERFRKVTTTDELDKYSFYTRLRPMTWPDSDIFETFYEDPPDRLILGPDGVLSLRD